MSTGQCVADFKGRRADALKDHTIEEHRGEFTRRVAFETGYDHRAFPEDCGGGGHGQNGMTVRFILLGVNGATQFVFNLTDFVPGNWDGHGHVPSTYRNSAMAYDLGYHWRTARYESQSDYDCDLLPGGKCYYDGSGLNANPVLEGFIQHGPGFVWERLEELYRELSARPGPQ